MILPGREDPRNISERASEIKSWEKLESVFSLYDQMRWCLSTPGSPEYILPRSVYLRYPCISVRPCRPVPLRHPCISVHPASLSPLPS